MCALATMDHAADAYVDALPSDALVTLSEDWLWRKLLARPEQIEPQGDWRRWILRGGRGSGKTRPASELITERVNKGVLKQILVVGRTSADVREYCVRGPSGLLTVGRRFPRNLPRFLGNRSNSGVVIWPNGAEAFVFSADKPDAFRGGGYQLAWLDELFHWQRAQMTYDMIAFSLREQVDGGHTQYLITSTPKPIPLCKALLNAPSTVVTRARLQDNAANLDPDFVKDITERYEGTRLWRQEGDGELLEDNPNALWRREDIDATRMLALVHEVTDAKGKTQRTEIPLERVVIGVDPSGNDGTDEDASEAGIVAVAKGYPSNNQPAHFYVLGDFSTRGTPLEWARATIAAYRSVGASRICAERNFGGEMVRQTIQSVDASVPITLVNASRDKAARAEPASALYEQRRVHHIGDPRGFLDLEDQMCSWQPPRPGTPKMKSPDRLDALVWALSALDTAAEAFERQSGFAGFGVFGGRR